MLIFKWFLTLYILFVVNQGIVMMTAHVSISLLLNIFSTVSDVTHVFFDVLLV